MGGDREGSKKGQREETEGKRDEERDRRNVRIKRAQKRESGETQERKERNYTVTPMEQNQLEYRNIATEDRRQKGDTSIDQTITKTFISISPFPTSLRPFISAVNMSNAVHGMGG